MNSHYVGLGNKFEVQIDNMSMCVVNIHGVYQPGDKKDNNHRITQSLEIIKSVSNYEYPVVIGGDFNLLLDTKSIELFEQKGFKNLIKDCHIETTRSSDAWGMALKRHEEVGIPIYERQYYSDYVFVTDSVNVKSFKVPDLEISDHLPLILEIDD